MLTRNCFSWSILFGAYIGQKKLEEAIEIFWDMPERDVVSWTAMISAYAQQGQINDAFHLFEQMPHRNVVSWNAMLVGFAHEGHIHKALHLFQQMPQRNVISWTALVSGLVKDACFEEAIELFEEMPERNLMSWNTILVAYVQQGQVEEAFNHFEQMPWHDIASWTTMVTAYVKEGQFVEALDLFQKMPHRDLISWNVIIAGCAEGGELAEIMQLFQQMQLERVKPDKITFISVLDACGREANLEKGQEFHRLVVNCGLDMNVHVQTALISMYARCGSLEDAIKVFKNIHQHDLVSWTAMIAAFAQHGHGSKVLELIQRMLSRGMLFDEITFRSILGAFCHSNMVNEGCHYFITMWEDHGIIPVLEHCNCIIDLIGQAKWLDEAEAFLSNIPFEPSVTSWGTLLGKCRIHVDLERAARAAEFISELDPGNASPYVLLANLYASGTELCDAADFANMVQGHLLT